MRVGRLAPPHARLLERTSETLAPLVGSSSVATSTLLDERPRHILDVAPRRRVQLLESWVVIHANPRFPRGELIPI